MNVPMKPSYRALRLMARATIYTLTRVRIEGLEHVPRTGPCILVPNHQSVLDFLLVQGVFPREVDTMTKSTQFSGPFVRWLLVRGRAFPVRRYRVDPQAVRVFLRRLDEGRVVCLYPEGERTWDGKLQPLRRGALNVILRSGAPVLPVGIEGMFDVWPRWGSHPRLGRRVHLRFGEPIRFGAHRCRAARRAALEDADRRLTGALLRLSGEPASTDVQVPEAPESGPPSSRHGGSVQTDRRA